NIYNSQLDAFELYHKTLEENTRSPQNGPVLPALGHALAGSVGSAISNLTLYPLDLVITRLQVQRQLRKTFTSAEDGEYKGVLDAFAQIYYKEGGIFAFYKGLIQDTGKSFADSFLFFLFYNYARSNRLHQRGGNAKSLPILDELSVGAVAGACSKFFTTPIANIVTRKKTAAMLSARSGSIYKEPTVAEIASDIRSEKGFQGFWSGYSASLVLTLNPSITFFLYEFFKRCLPRSKRDDPRAILTFLMAAVSKAIASTITYPFSLAKTRAQISKAPPVNPDSVADFKEEVEGIDNKPIMRKAGRGLKDLAQRSTVFNTIFQIYRTEGVAALYEGISGEILKGFFSHGITMLIKEAVHKLIIQTYFLILKAIRKYPSPSELATQAGGAVQENAEKASVMVKDGYETVIGKAEETVQDGKKSLGAVKERIDNV
ncbi:putative peroxisomal adenine nucleotide transporter 1, partial [Calycina marina]